MAEFSRTERLDRLGPAAQARTIEADAAERAALARRFGLQALDALTATMEIRADARGIHVEGRFHAEAVQSCVATGDPVPATLDLPIALLFVAPDAMAAEEEIELDADQCDIVEHDGQSVDLGEAVAQSLALALDPFPRVADADARLKAAGVLSEDEAGPFGALAALKDKLEKKA